MTAITVDPLIAEAKRRARRRRGYLLAILAIAVAGALTYELLPSGSSGGSRSVSGGRAIRHRGVGTVGSSGGVTWVMNGRGLWLAANGGSAWRKVAVPQGTGFIYPRGSDVQFVDPQHGWISISETEYSPNRGSRSMFARTTDGGRTWQPSFPSYCHGRCGATAMDFLDARHGFLVAGAPDARIPNQLFRTTDGGQTWQPVAKASISGPITFLNDRVGFAFENRGFPGLFYFGPPMGTLYRTTDGGATWWRYNIAGSKSLVEEPIRVGRRIVVVQAGPNRDGGVNFAPGTIYVSADGRHWSGSAVPGRPSEKTAFTAASSIVWAFSTGQNVYMTHDAGRHWRKIGIPHGPKRYRYGLLGAKINFTSSRAGWMVLDQRLYRTTDGGMHWAKAGPAKGKWVLVHACNPDQLTASFWLSRNRRNRRNLPGHLSISNPGRIGCRLSGWPTVVAVKADGSTVQAKRIPLASPPARSVVLGPGGGVDAQVYGIDLKPGDGAGCPRVVRLRVTPPGGHTATTLAGPWRASAGRNFYFPLCGGISVTPVH